MKILYSNLFFLMLIPVSVNASPFADDLGKCLVENTSSIDRENLMLWMASGMSQHPIVGEKIQFTKREITLINVQTAEIFERLLTNSCSSEFQKAQKFHGDEATEQAFKYLGGVAGGELFANEKVTNSMMEFTKYIDFEKFE